VSDSTIRLGITVGAIGAVLLAGAAAAQVPALADLSIEDLANIRVTTVSRQPVSVADAPASIYVITHEDIRRAGVTSLPEALRLAPNLQVARVDSVQYAISARGFNNAVGNKLLVMIDGRTVYTPLFSGVFWDQQDVMLADVDRIEVISGPGATLWGANAVNGVINVITQTAGETQGTRVSVKAGAFERLANGRYGGALGDNGHFRVYGKVAKLDNTQRASGADAFDEWDRAQAGFRADWDLGRDALTLQSDVYSGESIDRGVVVGLPFGRVEVSGANVLGRWTRQLEGGSELQLQSYFDHAERDDFLFFRPKADIFDVEAQHSVVLGRHRLVWGGGYRHSSDDIATGFVTAFIPRGRDLAWQNLFAQEQIALGEKVELTVGLKLENNDFTGTESLPSARVGWKPTAKSLVWADVSRAVRAPSRFDKDVYFPGSPPFFVIGGPNFVSEVADVVEAGYRGEPSDTWSYSVTVFHNDWDKLRSGTALPVQLENRIEGTVQGVEAWATWRVAPKWQLSGGLATLDKDLFLEPGSTDPVGVNNETLANDADYEWSLRAMADLPHDLTLDVRARHVAELPNPAVPGYTSLDAALGWRPSRLLTLVFTVENMLDESHAEYGPSPTRSVIERTALLEATLHFGN
jgi:iron complex outermembrane receptor protein